MADPRKYAHYNESIERVIKNTQVAVSNSFATTHPAVAATTANSNTSVLANPVSSAAINPPAAPAQAPTAYYQPFMLPTLPAATTTNFLPPHPTTLVFSGPTTSALNSYGPSWTPLLAPVPAMPNLNHITFQFSMPGGQTSNPTINRYRAKWPKTLNRNNATAGTSAVPLPAGFPSLARLTALAQLPYTVKAEPAIPPNWKESYNKAIHVLTPYTTIPVPNHSKEFQTLAALVEPQLTISGINRVVNPELWNKFLQMRKELMSKKSEDMEILGALGLPEEELLHRAHVSMNFDKDPGLVAVDYSDNVALLFHCTRGKFEPILNQGLDERLGNATGLLGRGIYFADDPLKSIGYDANSTLLVFAVFLGDCLNVSNFPNAQTFVREPPKVKEQQRNHMDLFFDSIVGRPAGVNEFVIYNRYQCCPLYTITYARGTSIPEQDDYTRSRANVPPFAWSPKTKNSRSTIAMPPTGNMIWPFFGQTIFAQMAEEGEESTTPVNGAGATLPAKDSQASRDDDKGDGEESIAMKLSTLWELGFKDDESNLALLKKLNYNLEGTIDTLLQGNSTEESQPAIPASVPTKRKKFGRARSVDSGLAVSVGSGDDGTTNARVVVATSTSSSTLIVDNEDYGCLICYNESPSHWQTLKCSHKVCEACYLQLETSGTTMSGQQHTFLKCPFCQACSGLEIGSCPTGTIKVDLVGGAIPGYEIHPSHYVITYNVPGSVGLHRIAYVPGSPEGMKVVDLLRIAWDRRLTFAIGTSATTGAQNVLVWNIHHKTAIYGGIQAHGYPDPTYLTRVQQELSQYGIE